MGFDEVSYESIYQELNNFGFSVYLHLKVPMLLFEK